MAEVTIRDGRIASIGTPQPDHPGEVVNLDGRYLVPGLWDSHVHFTTWVQNQHRLDVSAAHSASHAASLVGDRLRAESDSTDTLVGYGFRDALWLDTPSGEVLDEIAPHRPVVLIAGDYHCVWLNTAAKRRYGLDSAGLLQETDAFALQRMLAADAADAAVLPDSAVPDAAAFAASRGVVGVVDFEMADNIQVWKSRIDAGVDALRVRAGFYPELLDTMIQRHVHSGTVIPGTDGLLSVGSLKVISDGTLNTRTALCHDPYPDTGDYGVNTVPPAELNALLTRAKAHGFNAAVHAIGDHANTLALDAFEATGAHGSVEHAQLLTDADVDRFAALGIVASMQPEHAMDDRDVADALWPDRTSRAFRLASLHDAGAHIALGSDAPVAPLDPWVTMAAATGRARDGREPWHPEQQVTQAVALASSTGGATIRGGAVADLVVCERNPYAASADVLRTMPVAATLVGGRFTFREL